MLRKIKIQVFALVVFVFITPVQVNAISPSAQQIEQFKNMPRAQQEALAQQMGIIKGCYIKQGEVLSSKNLVIKCSGYSNDFYLCWAVPGKSGRKAYAA